jgi:hypothetical protein
MITASKLAGFFAGHALWCLSDGDSLVPMLAYTTEKGQRRLERLAGEDVAACVALGQQRLAANPQDANDAVLLYVGRISGEQDTSDAIIIEMRAYFSPWSEAVLAVPYSRAGGSLRVHRPTIVVWKDCEDFDQEVVYASFLEGIAAHEHGAKIWNASHGPGS